MHTVYMRDILLETVDHMLQPAIVTVSLDWLLQIHAGAR